MACFVNSNDAGVFQGGHGPHANSLPCEAAFTKKTTTLQDGHDGFFALLGHNRELDLALLQIKHGIRRIPLRKDNVVLSGFRIVFPLPTLVRKVLGLKGEVRLRAIEVA